MKVSAFLDLGVIHQAFSPRPENPKDDTTFKSAQCRKRDLKFIQILESSCLSFCESFIRWVTRTIVLKQSQRVPFPPRSQGQELVGPYTGAPRRLPSGESSRDDRGGPYFRGAGRGKKARKSTGLLQKW